MIRNILLSFQALDAEEKLALKTAKSSVELPQNYRTNTNYYSRSSIEFEIERRVGSLWKVASGVCGVLAGYYLFVQSGEDSTITVLALAAAAAFAFLLYQSHIQSRVQRLVLRRQSAVAMVQRDIFKQLAKLRYGDEETEKLIKVMEVITQFTVDGIHAADKERMQTGMSEEDFYRQSGKIVDQKMSELLQHREYEYAEMRRQFLAETFIQAVIRVRKEQAVTAESEAG